MAGDHAQSEAELLEQLTTRIRESLLPVDQPFEKGELEEAASLVLETASNRPDGEPMIAIADTGSGRRRLRRTTP